MEDFEWRDPLLITDVPSLLQPKDTPSHLQLYSSSPSIMEDPDDFTPPNIDGRSALGFSSMSPDLVICMNSPDIPMERCEDTPEFLNGGQLDVSLENGIKGPEIKGAYGREMAKKDDDMCTEASFELPVTEDTQTKNCSHILSINVGSSEIVALQGGMPFSEDKHFTGGDTMRSSDPVNGDGEGLSLYQTARFGNFTYHFNNLVSGSYVIDLHFAEIVFTNGHPGTRVFDIYIQGEKVISCLDIYARIGANKPLVISDLKTYVKEEEGLSIRFEGVTGNPIVSGICIRKDSSTDSGEIAFAKGACMPEYKLLQDDCYETASEEFHRIQAEHEYQKKELAETKRALEELKMENELKSTECQEAWNSLKELQNELMRKSMHVGSLAFAIEGQVKEKGRWFSSLRDMTRKLKILKMDQIKLTEEASLFKQCLADMDGLSSIIQSTLFQHLEVHEDLKIKLLQAVKEQKELYNKVLELKGNIRVFCRCRPQNMDEISAGASIAIDFASAKDGELIVKSNGMSRKAFKFDAVFSPEADQVDVFENTAPLATSVLDGYNVCIFAYGQTGTGKTFTMEGTDEARGVNYRTLQELFRIIEERRNTFRYEISVSALEVYNEQIRDLLVSGSQSGAIAKRLEIKQLVEGGHPVPGLVEAYVSNVNEVWQVLQAGSKARAVGSTNANEHSSRSHCMHCVMVKGENLLNGECTRSKLWLVDLAGSERIAKTEVQGERLKETQNINRSLSALGDVISSLATRSPHIPFRNSKLTHLLQDSLGGDSKALMFVQISPNENDLTETLCSLNFASRVRGIELGLARKQMDSSELPKYKLLVEKLRQDMKSKDFQVKKLEDSNHCLEVKLKDKDIKNRNLQEKIKELESQLLVERKLARQHVDSRIAEQQQQHQQDARQKLEEQNYPAARAPLATKTIKFQCESNDQVNITRPFTEKKKFPLPAFPMDGLIRQQDSLEKENNPDIVSVHLPLQKQTGRASLCPTKHKSYTTTASRRNSLIPIPSSTGTAKLPPTSLPLMPIQADCREDPSGVEETCLPEKTPCDSPKELTSGTKRLGSILRRSLQKRIQMRSPLQQNIRRLGVNVGTEKVRLSIGSRRRMGQRVFLGNARRVVIKDKDPQEKQSQRDKERGWNTSTVTRNVL